MKGPDTDDTDGDKSSDTDSLVNLKNEIGAWLVLPKFNTWEDSLYDEQKQTFWQKLLAAKLQYNTFNFREGFHNALRKRGTIWPDKVAETKKYPFIYNMVNALTASFLGLAVVVPMDFLRALHIMYRNWPRGPQRITFHSLFACDEYPFKDRAFTTMYRDMAKDFMLIFPQFAIKLAVNEYYVYAITSRQESRFATGFVAATIAQIFSSPVGAVKEFLGHIPIPDKDHPGRENINEFKSVYEAAKHLYKVNGIRGFYGDWLCKSLVRSRIFAIVNVLYDMEVAALIHDTFII